MNKINIHSALRYAAAQLKQNDQPVNLVTELLLAHVLAKPHSYLFAHPEEILTESSWHEFLTSVAAYGDGKPLAYCRGYQEFYGIQLAVNTHTLIPRIETELLVELILQKYPHEKELKCVDLGTGSGAIALALATQQPSWNITATDISSQALQMAQLNASKLAMNHVEFLLSDWCSQLPKQYFNVIVSNPPYVAYDDPHVQDSVRYEPELAVFADDDGLNALTQIMDAARQHLTMYGSLWLEHGYAQGACVRDRMAQLGYHNIQSFRDFAGIERVTCGTIILDSAVGRGL